MQTAFLIYSFLYLISILILLPKEYLKRPSSIRNRWLKEKFGFFKDNNTKIVKNSQKLTIWIHAVSVGEVIAVSNLIKKLTSKYDIVLSTITDTGQKVARDRFKDCSVNVIYMPFDIPCAINKTLKHFNPSFVMLTETELWPNLMRIVSQNLPLMLINGRLSEKSYKGYGKIKFFIKPLLNKFSIICVQEDGYRERFINLGADQSKIYVTGNMKFDIELEKIVFTWEDRIPHPVIVAGSTHESEEEIILDAFLKLNMPVSLLIAPRHPERFENVEGLIKRKIKSLANYNIFFSRLSGLPSDLNLSSSACIILVDQMGILGSLYRVSDIAIIGGSFIPHGGQNPLEPAYWQKPIICGPHMHNFPFIEQFLTEKACLMADENSLLNIMKELVKNAELRELIGDKAYQLFLAKSGATEKTIKLIQTLIP